MTAPSVAKPSHELGSRNTYIKPAEFFRDVFFAWRGDKASARGAAIRVYDDAGNVIETHEQAGDFKEW